jgi:hypothetical protein
MVTYWASTRRRGLIWSSSCLDAVQKVIPDSRIVFVLPGTGVAEYSQDRMAKKKPAMVMSAITVGAESRRVVVARPVDWNPEQVTQQLGCDGFLSVRRGVGVIVSPEQGTQGRSHVGASREVKGAVLDMVPERRSQTACGTAHSACDH